MGFLTSIFGGDNVVVTVLVALAIVLVLIVFGVWALKLVFNATGRATRGRAKRLGIVDVTPVDQKRQLVLIRRDNVEHLLLIGGAQDLVVETGIPVEQQAGLRPTRPGPAPAPAPQPAAPEAAPAFPGAPKRPKRTNLPSDIAAMSGTATPRGSMRHTALVRPPERLEPDFIPTPEQASSPMDADSDKQADTEPVPTDTGAGSDQPDYRGEPNLDPDGSETRSGEQQQDK